MSNSMKKNHPEKQMHTLAPVYDSRSRILILGSFASVKSRETGFYYGHPRNRFWKVLAGLFGETEPETVPEKRALLLGRGVALYDVIESCTITGSSDSSIRDVVPADLDPILEAADIRQIFCNGGTSFRLYRRYLESRTGREALGLPSTSPANAACSLEQLLQAWKICLDFV